MFKTISVLSLGLVMAISSSSQAKELLSWEADPISDPAPGFQWDGVKLTAGPGMFSNGDGNNQAPGGNGVFSKPGLRTSVAFLLNGVSSSHATATSTTFFDTSMSVTGLAAVGNAANFGGLLVQSLGSGTFTFTSSNDTVGGPVVLLTGTITDASLSGISASNTGSVISATVTYTSGLIFDAMVSNGFDTVGSASWSLVDINPVLKIDPVSHLLAAFSSNSSGLFAAEVIGNTPSIPSPAALPAGLALLGGLALARRMTRIA
jgi:hypothetical protein